jgi:regulator of sigma E protease
LTAFVAILSFLVVILGLVLAHEMGHFISAKANGVRVLEFGIGLPPRLFGIKRGDTTYSVNAFPLGGFVKLAGEEDPSAPGSLAGKSIAVRLLVLSSGALMNLVLPFLLFAVAFMVPHQVYKGEVVVEDVSPASPAAEAGIVPGDTLLQVNGRTLDHAGDLSRSIQLNLGRQITISLRRANEASG